LSGAWTGGSTPHFSALLSTLLLLVFACLGASGCSGLATTKTAAATTSAATSAQELATSSSTLNFSNVTVGQTATQNVTLTNTGSADVSISKVSISGAGFGATGVPSGLMLTPGQTATLDVSFAPAGAGAASGTVTLSSTAANPTDTVTLSGTGVKAVLHEVTLSWMPSPSAGVTGYDIYRSTGNGLFTAPLNSTPVPPSTMGFTDSTVVAGQTYQYIVTALGTTGVQSADSNEVTVTIP
jgi:hypothetical protein